MIGFLVSSALLVLLCLAILLPGLVKPRRIHSVDMDQENLAISRERLDVLGSEGVDADGSATEIETALLDDLGGPAYALEGPPRSSRVTALLLALTIPLAAGGMYLWIGDTRWAGPPDPQASPRPDGLAGEADIPALLRRLEQSLEENPGNADGWAIAGRTYMALNNFAAAENAYARVHELVGDDPDILTAWADASLMRNGGQYTPEISSRIERALALDPVQMNALWIGAMGYRSLGDGETSNAYLERLRPLLAGNTEALSQLESMLAASPPIPGETDEKASELARIEVSVSVDPDLVAKLDPATPVFVFARPVEGPPMPLAARRLTLAELPVTVLLDDQAGMVQGRSLSSVETVKVAARVAVGGTPTAQSGDFTSATVESPTRSQARLELRIERVVP